MLDLFFFKWGNIPVLILHVRLLRDPCRNAEATMEEESRLNILGWGGVGWGAACARGVMLCSGHANVVFDWGGDCGRR